MNLFLKTLTDHKNVGNFIAIFPSVFYQDIFLYRGQKSGDGEMAQNQKSEKTAVLPYLRRAAEHLPTHCAPLRLCDQKGCQLPIPFSSWCLSSVLFLGTATSIHSAVCGGNIRHVLNSITCATELGIGTGGQSKTIFLFLATDFVIDI